MSYDKYFESKIKELVKVTFVTTDLNTHKLLKRETKFISLKEYEAINTNDFYKIEFLKDETIAYKTNAT